jgi:hypothetical protein
MTDQSKSEQQIDTSAQRVDGIDLPPLPEHCGWQWLDTGQFRKALPDAAEPAAWNRLYTANQMRAYATAAVAAERERWARIADSYHVGEPPEEPTAAWIAAAIRGEQK